MAFKLQLNLKSLLQTKKLAKLFAVNFSPPLVILLFGPLGIGKTQFIKFFGYFLGIKNINSPSFVKMQIYSLPQNQKLVHIDGFHLHAKSDLNQFFDYFDADYLLFEWAENFEEYFSDQNVIKLFWSWDKNGQRIVNIESYCKILPEFNLLK